MAPRKYQPPKDMDRWRKKPSSAQRYAIHSIADAKEDAQAWLEEPYSIKAIGRSGKTKEQMKQDALLYLRQMIDESK